MISVRGFFWSLVAVAGIIALSFFWAYGKALPTNESEMAEAVDTFVLNEQESGVNPLQQVQNMQRQALRIAVRLGAGLGVALVVICGIIFLVGYKRQSSPFVERHYEGQRTRDTSVVRQTLDANTPTHIIDPAKYTGSIHDTIDRL